MKALIFVLAFLVCLFAVPDAIFGELIERTIDIPGDGEDALNFFEFTVLSVKIVFSLAVAWGVVTLSCGR